MGQNLDYDGTQRNRTRYTSYYYLIHLFLVIILMDYAARCSAGTQQRLWREFNVAMIVPWDYKRDIGYWYLFRRHKSGNKDVAKS